MLTEGLKKHNYGAVDLTNVKKIIEETRSLDKDPLMESGSICSSESPANIPLNVKAEDLAPENPIMIEGSMSGTDPIILPKIVDKSGRLSSVVKEYQEKIKSDVVPLEITPIQDEVVELKDYNIYAYGGKRFATEKDNNAELIESMVKDIASALANGEEYSKSMLTEMEFEGKMVTTLVMTPEEWSLLVAKFARYGAKIYEYTDNGYDLRLVVRGWTGE